MNIRIAIATFMALTIAGCGPASTAQAEPDAPAGEQAAYDAADTQPEDPVDAYVWRMERCLFLGSEIAGDRSAADNAVQTRMEALDCEPDSLQSDGMTLRTTYASDAAAIAKIDAALTDLEEY